MTAGMNNWINRMRILRLLDEVDDTWLMKWQDPATINVCYHSSQTGNQVDNRYGWEHRLG